MSFARPPAAQATLRWHPADTSATCDSRIPRSAATAADEAAAQPLGAGSISSALPLLLAAERPIDARPDR